MTSFRNFVVVAACFVVLCILFPMPSYSQTGFFEQTLTSDILVEDAYQPGNGLPVGKIQSVWGEALIFHRDPTVAYRVQTGLPLYTGDIIRTRALAWIQCRLIDGSQIALRPDTILTIRQSLCSSARKTCGSLMFLKYGSARFKLSPLADLLSYEFKVQTDLAFASAGKADFIVTAMSDATGFVALEKSRIEIARRSQPEEITVLSNFQKTTLSDNIISPTVAELPGKDVETILAAFYPSLPSTLLADSSAGDRDPEDSESKVPNE